MYVQARTPVDIIINTRSIHSTPDSYFSCRALTVHCNQLEIREKAFSRALPPARSEASLFLILNQHRGACSGVFFRLCSVAVPALNPHSDIPSALLSCPVKSVNPYLTLLVLLHLYICFRTAKKPQG